MKSSSVLAKQFGLGRYLDQPDELNHAIFNLMLLQETIQIENARRKKNDQPASTAIAVKRNAFGKFIAACSGDNTYRYAVETALKASTANLAVFQRSRFINVLRSMGVPEDKIAEYCDTVTVDDDTYCMDQE